LFPKNALSGARWALAIAALLCLPLSSRAADTTVIRPVLEVEQAWDSNVFNSSEQAITVPRNTVSCPDGFKRANATQCTADSEESSLITYVRPTLWLENKGDRGYARFGIGATGRSVWEESDLSGIDGRANLEFDQTLTPIFGVFGSAGLVHYDDYQAIIGSPQTVLVETGDGGLTGTDVVDGPVSAPQQPALNTDELLLGVKFVLGPRTDFRLSGSAGRWNYEKVEPIFSTISGQLVGAKPNDFRDRTILNGRALLSHRLTPVDTLDLIVDQDSTEYQNLGTGAAESDITSARIGWSREWSPRWLTSLNIGARTLKSTDSEVPGYLGGSVLAILPSQPGCVQYSGIVFQCPTNAFIGYEDKTDRGTGLIGGISIQRTFARSILRISYDRDTRSTGGAGQTDFDIDAFRADFVHRLSERVRLTVRGEYTLLHSTADEIAPYPASVSIFDAGGGEVGYRATCGGLGGSAQEVGSFIPPGGSAAIPGFQCFGGSSEETRKFTIVSARVDWQVRRRMTAYFAARYFQPIVDRQGGNSREFRVTDYDKFTFGLGLRYEWESAL
jgi:hypothetical protein